MWSASSQPLKQLIHLASSTTRRTSSRFIVSCCSPSTTTATTAGGGSRIAGRNRRSASSSSSSTSDRDAIRAIRLKKVEELRNKGLEPYAYKWDRTHTANQLQDIYRHLGNGEELNSESDYVSIAGRIVARRAFGKLAFFTLRDDSGTIQLYCEKERLLNEQFEQLKTLVDIGDILGVSGSIKRTEKGKFCYAPALHSVISFLMRCKHANIYTLNNVCWFLVTSMVKKGNGWGFLLGQLGEMWGMVASSCRQLLI